MKHSWILVYGVIGVLALVSGCASYYEREDQDIEDLQVIIEAVCYSKAGVHVRAVPSDPMLFVGSSRRRVVQGETMLVYAPTWELNGYGSHARDAEFILDHVDENLDEFLNEYLAANVD